MRSQFLVGMMLEQIGKIGGHRIRHATRLGLPRAEADPIGCYQHGLARHAKGIGHLLASRPSRDQFASLGNVLIGPRAIHA